MSVARPLISVLLGLGVAYAVARSVRKDAPREVFN
jgi:hypothetical protein